MPSYIRLGIVGMGVEGKFISQALLEKKLPHIKLCAVCDSNPQSRALEGIAGFDTLDQMIESKSVDSVFIATPHPSHVSLGIRVLEAGLHLLIEKPIGIHVQEAQHLVDAAAKRPNCFAMMFNQRSDPMYQRLRALVQGGQLGALKRIAMTATDWFRSNAYYHSNSWRATWAGEGGGMLLNQCPHNLDLWQWIFGMPTSVQASIEFGKYHDIEVEDNVTALLRYANGCTGAFIASTGEAPGVSRLEVSAEWGLVTLENRKLCWKKNRESVDAFNCRNTVPSASLDFDELIEEYPDHGGQHIEILSNFAKHILHGDALMAAGAEGLASLELANAMILSALEQTPIQLPMDAAVYADRLDELIQTSRGNLLVTKS